MRGGKGRKNKRQISLESTTDGLKGNRRVEERDAVEKEEVG